MPCTQEAVSADYSSESTGNGLLVVKCKIYCKLAMRLQVNYLISLGLQSLAEIPLLSFLHTQQNSISQPPWQSGVAMCLSSGCEKEVMCIYLFQSYKASSAQSSMFFLLCCLVHIKPEHHILKMAEPQMEAVWVPQILLVGELPANQELRF